MAGWKSLQSGRLGVVGRRQVGRSAHQLRHLLGQLGEHLARGRAGRDRTVGGQEVGQLERRDLVGGRPGEARRRRAAPSTVCSHSACSPRPARADLAVALRRRRRARRRTCPVGNPRVRLVSACCSAPRASEWARWVPGVARAVPDDRLDRDERGLALDRDGRGDRRVQLVQVVAVRDGRGLPAVGLVALDPVLGERDLGVAVDRDVVVVVEEHQVVEAQMPGQRRGLARHALHQVAVRDDHEHPEPRRIAVPRPEVLTGDGHTNAGGGALAQRAGGGLDPLGVAILGMARRAAAPLPELLELRRSAGRTRSGAAASTAACSRGRPRARTGRARATANRPGLKRRWRDHRTCASGAHPSGNPGWPDFAFSTASSESVRTVLMHSWSVSSKARDTVAPGRRLAATARYTSMHDLTRGRYTSS